MSGIPANEEILASADEINTGTDERGTE